MRNIILLFLASFWIISCEDPVELPDSNVTGMKPIYQILSDDLIVEALDARPFNDLGKIVSRGSYIYINEKFKGIHVIDNTNPRRPVSKYFWQVEGNIDFTLKGQFLYAENSKDLLTIDISDPANIVLQSKIENIYKNLNGLVFPPNYFGPFECVDSSKGIVVDWEMATLLNPKCRR